MYTHIRPLSFCTDRLDGSHNKELGLFNNKDDLKIIDVNSLTKGINEKEVLSLIIKSIFGNNLTENLSIKDIGDDFYPKEENSISKVMLWLFWDF